jgi:hypothetical protein
MQSVKSLGLMGIAPLETVAPLSTAAAAAIVDAAERSAPAPAPKRKPRPTRRRVLEPRATGGLVKRISAAEAERDDLPDGVYVYSNGRGQTVTRQVGEVACKTFTAAMRVRALTRGGNDQLAEEIAGLIRRGA